MVNNDNYSKVKALAEQIVSAGDAIYLYGSRARGDNRADSDWDVLVLIDKPKTDESDYERYFYPLVELGWDLGEPVSPHMYTLSEWRDSAFTPFCHNVEQDKIRLA